MEDLNATTSVESLMNIIADKQSEHQERALQLLARKCIETEARKPLYAADNIEKLSEVAKTGTTYFLQLYAFECLGWGAQDKLGLSRDELLKLRKAVRDPTVEEVADLVTKLQDGSEQEKDDALLLCACVGTMAAFESLRRFDDKLLECLVKTLTSGTDTQKYWAVYALSTFAMQEQYRTTLEYENCIEACITLVHSGTDRQKAVAANTLGNMAPHRYVQQKIQLAGGIPALVAMVSTGTDEQQSMGMYALSKLALLDTNKPIIAKEGAIRQWVKLVQSGGDEVKRWAAYALGTLASNDDAIRVTIMDEGGIPALVTLVQSGTDDQKQWAAYALGNIACDNALVKDALRKADVKSALDGLHASEPAEVREAAKEALSYIRRYGKMHKFLDHFKPF